MDTHTAKGVGVGVGVGPRGLTRVHSGRDV